MNRESNTSNSALPKTAQMLVLAIVATAAIIGIVVYLTPIDEDEGTVETTETATDPTGTVVADPPSNMPLAGITEEERNKLLTTELKKLDLATEPLKIDVGPFKDELRDLAKTLVSDHPRDSGAYHFAAGIYAELLNTKQAEATWKACIELGSDSAGPYAGLAGLLIEDGREEEAIQLLLDAQAKGIGSKEISNRLSSAYENTGDLENAKKVLNGALLADPSDQELLLSLARILNQQNEFEEAEGTLRRALAMNLNSEQALFLLSTCLARQGKRDEAIQVRNRLNELKQKQEARKEGEFQDSYDTALREIGYQSYLSSAALAEKLGDWQNAEKYLKRALVIAPSGGEALMALSSVFRQQEKWLAAYAIQSALVDMQPENIFNYSNLASLAWQLGDIDYAEQTLEAGIQADPQGVLNQSALARISMVRGNLQRAKELAALVVERNRSVEAFVLLANVYNAAGEKEAAAAAFGEAQRINPNHPLLQPGNSAAVAPNAN